MSTRLPGPGCAPTQESPLRVFRVEPNTTEHVRTLSPRLRGCRVHWSGRRSEYCKGEDCDSRMHAKPLFWKGYTLVEVWTPAISKWMPWVLEVTEHLELDLRGVYGRGQVWELSRLPQSGSKKTPVTGKLVEELDPELLPAAIDITPVLLHVFHVEHIDLDAKNPLPPRVLVCASEGQPPPGMGSRKAPPPQLSEAERAHINALADATFGPKVNGRRQG